jgi:signal transduction histidine kinase
MPERTLKQRKWGFLFLALHLLLLSQVLWWGIVFCRDVNSLKELKIRNHWLQTQLGRENQVTLEVFEREALHQKVMFLSESVFFALVASLALWLLFKALRTEEKSRVSQRNFIEVISHESKTPLTALKLRLESVKEKLGEAPLTRDLNLALEEVRRLSSILEKSLELNRMERYSFSFELVDLSQLVSEVLRRMDPVFKEKQIDVHSQLSSGLVVRGDSFGLQNSIQSLIENSVLYNDAKEKALSVELNQQLGSVLFSVKDNGSGIAEKDEPFIFDRFYRGKAGKKVPGTGLGLYLTKQIISAHQGILRLVRSGQGAHFEIQLPLQAEAT